MLLSGEGSLKLNSLSPVSEVLSEADEANSYFLLTFLAEFNQSFVVLRVILFDQNDAVFIHPRPTVFAVLKVIVTFYVNRLIFELTFDAVYRFVSVKVIVFAKRILTFEGLQFAHIKSRDGPSAS